MSKDRCLRRRISVNVDVTSPDANTLISTMTLLHGTPRGSAIVCDLGSFLAPPSTFIKDPKDPQAVPAEKFQNESALVEVPEQNQLFVGAGVTSSGGNCDSGLGLWSLAGVILLAVSRKYRFLV